MLGGWGQGDLVAGCGRSAGLGIAISVGAVRYMVTERWWLLADFVTLTCPSCGGKLQIGDDVDRFACSHCGSEHLVRRGGGIVSLAPVVGELKGVRAGVDNVASELAINRLKGDIANLEQQVAQVANDGCVVLSLGIVSLLCGIALLTMSQGGGMMLSLPFIGMAVLLFRAALWNPAAHRVQEELQRKRAELARHEDQVRR